MICPCCKEKKINPFEMLTLKESSLLNFKCSNCNEQIKLPIGLILSYRYFNILFIFIALGWLNNQENLNTTFYYFIIAWLIFLVSIPVVLYKLPIKCIKIRINDYIYKDKKFSIVEKDMHLSTIKVFNYIMKILITLFVFSIFTISLGLDINNDFLLLPLIGLLIFVSYKLLNLLLFLIISKKTKAIISDYKIIHRVDEYYNDYNDYLLSYIYTYEVNGKKYTQTYDESDSQFAIKYKKIELACEELEKLIRNKLDIYFNPKRPTITSILHPINIQMTILQSIIVLLGIISMIAWFN